MHPPYHLSGMDGVGDRAYPCLVPGPIRLNVISAAAHFLISGLLDANWFPSEGQREGAIIISKI